MDKSPVSHDSIDADDAAAAKGGRVWSPPELTSPKPIPPRRSAFSLIKEALLWLPRLLEKNPALLLYWIAAYVLFGVIVVLLSSLSSDDKLAPVWEQEYGYQEVSLHNGATEAEVVTTAGETMNVDAIQYKGAWILFSGKEQMDEKIAEVENGTYPEELYW